MVLSDPAASGAEVERRVKSMVALIPQAAIAGAGTGMGGAAGISYKIGGDPAAIDEAAQRIAAALRRNPYAADVQTSDAGLRPRYQLDVDSRAARCWASHRMMPPRRHVWRPEEASQRANGRMPDLRTLSCVPATRQRGSGRFIALSSARP